jgi:glycosyltransferase involved in cell wall biosynthesis
MHIVIFADPVDNQRAGVHFYTKNLISALIKTDKLNKYTLIHRRENPFFEGMNHVIIPKKKRCAYEVYRRFYLIPKMVKKLKADLVLEPSQIGPFCIPKRIKRAVIIHDLTPIIFPEFHPRKRVRTHRLLFKRIMKNADLILTPSETTKNDINKHYKTKNNIKTIYAGKNPSSETKTKSPIKEKYILYFGTLEPRKNLEILTEAFLELKKEINLPHKLILAGGIGWKSKKLMKKISPHNEIIITGYLSEEEKHAYYQNADIFIYPSIYEGFGLPPLEAMGYGIPVICSNGGSLNEIYKNHALIFDHKNKEELKNHIKTLLKNPELREKLIKKGLEYSKELTWEATAKKAIEAFSTFS